MLYFSRCITQNLWNCAKLAVLIPLQTANDLVIPFSNNSHYCSVIVFYEAECSEVGFSHIGHFVAHPCVRKTLQNLHFSRYIDQTLWECVKLAALVALQTANDLVIPFSNYSHYCSVIVFYETGCIFTVKLYYLLIIETIRIST